MSSQHPDYHIYDDEKSDHENNRFQPKNHPSITPVDFPLNDDEILKSPPIRYRTLQQHGSNVTQSYLDAKERLRKKRELNRVINFDKLSVSPLSNSFEWMLSLQNQSTFDHDPHGIYSDRDDNS